ncbi:glycosyltransferase family 2 protein [Azonexus hydrophilus]
MDASCRQSASSFRLQLRPPVTAGACRLHQLGENDALIVIDDGSTDDTAQCLAEYTARHPGLSAVRQENAGAAAARNHGIRLAKTPYVLLLDADDELMPDALDIALNHLQRPWSRHDSRSTNFCISGWPRTATPAYGSAESFRQVARRYL